MKSKKVTVMSKKSVFSGKIRVTPSVAAPGDTNPSDATGQEHRKVQCNLHFGDKVKEVGHSDKWSFGRDSL